MACLHPVEFTDDKGVLRRFPCGHCEACLVSKSYRSSSPLHLEELSHSYSYFVTLTYSDEYIPICECETSYDDEHPYKVRFVLSNRDRKDYATTICEHDFYYQSAFDSFEYLRTCGKLPINGFISPLYKRDYQLFLKSVRKYVYYYTGSYLRTYVCGEYGPKHFRPHWHILFFFDDEEVQSVLPEAVFRCWQYGRIDYQRVNSSATSYLSQYCCSNSFVPSVYKINEFSPCSHHSIKLGMEHYLQNIDTIHTSQGLDWFTSQSFDFNSKPRQVLPWRSPERAVFPKCLYFSQLNFEARLRTYTIERELQGYFGKVESVKELAQLCINHVYTDCFGNFEKLTPFMRFMYQHCRYFWNEYGDQIKFSHHFMKQKDCERVWLYYVVRNFPYYRDLLLSRICQAISISRKFYQLCDRDWSNSRDVCRQICEYYDHYMPISNLKKWYTSQSDFANHDVSQYYANVNYFYDNFPTIGTLPKSFSVLSSIEYGFLSYRTINNTMPIQELRFPPVNSTSLYQKDIVNARRQFNFCCKHRKQNEANYIQFEIKGVQTPLAFEPVCIT